MTRCRWFGARRGARTGNSLLISSAVRSFIGSSLVILTMGFSACTQAPKPTSVPAPDRVSEHQLNEQAVLIELADRKLFEPVIVQRVAQAGPQLRSALATALGRIGDPRGLDPLEQLLVDENAEVRRVAAFNLGLLGDSGAVPALLQAAADDDPETGRLAVEALGKLKASLASVETALGTLPDAAERRQRLLPSLYRFHELAALPVAREALSGSDPDQVRWAAYALAREPFPEALNSLRELLASPDPLIRSWSARALGKVGEASDLDRLLPLLADAAPGVVIEALRAGGALIADGRAAPPDRWRGPILELIGAQVPGIRMTAIGVSSHWLLDDAISAALLEKLGSGVEREAELALQALAEGKDPRAPAEIERAAASKRFGIRAAAAAAASAYGSESILLRLSRDSDPRVRMSAISEILQARSPALPQVRARALADPDPGVRALALDDLAEHPVTGWQSIEQAMRGPGSENLADVRISGAQALAARAAADESERPAIEQNLTELSRDGNYLVRRAAVAGLKALHIDAPQAEPIQTGKDLAAYRQVVRTTRNRPLVDVQTERGTIQLRLDCPEAPLTCLNFLQLAAQGYFNGLTFHRIVPDFVVQGGDPLGNGWGGPGYAIRDEINRLRYDRGAVGMALSGPDTGGSQFFITLAPQPHLDGRYTVFGHVVAGETVLDQLIQGDHIEAVVVPGAGLETGVQ